MLWFALSTLAAARSAARSSPDLRALQSRLDAIAIAYNTSYSVGVVHPTLGAFGVAAGIADKLAGTPATTETRYPVGSVTKPWTAAAVMQLYEQGLVDIDAPIETYVDPILMRGNGTNMTELWRNKTTGVVDERVHLITARMAMGMRAGLNDYNNTWYIDVTENDPTLDITPFDLLHRLDKHFICDPGSCGKYASTGFELLGLLLAQVTGAERWEDYDQLSVIPIGLRDQFTRTAFPGRGLCADVPHVVHQYATTKTKSKLPWSPFSSSMPQSIGENVTFEDLFYDSCLNGWTCGNIAAAPIDIARFHYHLHNLDVVNETSLAQMMAWKPMTQGWEPQLYGLALMQTFPERGSLWFPDPENITYIVGHGGADYGSYGIVAGFNMKYRFGISVTVSSVTSLNCTDLPNGGAERYYYYDAVCAALDEVLHIASNGTAPRLNCTSCTKVGSVGVPYLPFGPADPNAPPPPTCSFLKPASKVCLPWLTKTCGPRTPGNVSIGACETCVKNATRSDPKSKLHGCTSTELQNFCPPTKCTADALTTLCNSTHGKPFALCKQCVANVSLALGCPVNAAKKWCNGQPLPGPPLTPPPGCASLMMMLCPPSPNGTKVARHDCKMCTSPHAASGAALVAACGGTWANYSHWENLYCEYIATAPGRKHATCVWDLGPRSERRGGEERREGEKR